MQLYEFGDPPESVADNVTEMHSIMPWEFLVLASVGLFLALVYGIREWLFFRDLQRRRYRLLADYHVQTIRPNVPRRPR